jgi:glycosyltransferase involved in cell wall biosynthesis
MVKKISVILPCLNEEQSIGICIDRVRAVFPHAEIIVVDNGSTDHSSFIAKQHGALVYYEDKRGYGAAYLSGFSLATGDYYIMLDSDLTYDPKELPMFITLLNQGNDFVLGNRFGGKIVQMPWKSRYIGNPVLSGMFRLLYKTKITDIHCGMRAFTQRAYLKMKLKTPGMEFASEMVASALKNKLRIAEVDINYYQRAGKSKLMPIRDAIRHILFMIKYKCQKYS